MRNITLNADERLIEAGRARALAERTTLNEAFRQWLTQYANTRGREQRYEEVMAPLRGKLKVGRRLRRDARSER